MSLQLPTFVPSSFWDCYLSLPPLHLFISLPLYISPSLSLSLSIFLPLGLSPSRCLPLSGFLSLSLSLDVFPLFFLCSVGAVLDTGQLHYMPQDASGQNHVQLVHIPKTDSIDIYPYHPIPIYDPLTPGGKPCCSTPCSLWHPFRTKLQANVCFFRVPGSGGSTSSIRRRQQGGKGHAGLM